MVLKQTLLTKLNFYNLIVWYSDSIEVSPSGKKKKRKKKREKKREKQPPPSQQPQKDKGHI